MRSRIDAGEFIKQISKQMSEQTGEQMREQEALWETDSPSARFPARARACALLTLFGGLHVGGTGAGQSRADRDVEFLEEVLFDVDDEDCWVAPWTPLLGHLAGIAEAHNNYLTIYVDDAGRFYAYAHITGALYPIGGSFDEAMTFLLGDEKFGAPIDSGESCD